MERIYWLGECIRVFKDTLKDPMKITIYRNGVDVCVDVWFNSSLSWSYTICEGVVKKKIVDGQPKRHYRKISTGCMDSLVSAFRGCNCVSVGYSCPIDEMEVQYTDGSNYCMMFRVGTNRLIDCSQYILECMLDYFGDKVAGTYRLSWYRKGRLETLSRVTTDGRTQFITLDTVNNTYKTNNGQGSFSGESATVVRILLVSRLIRECWFDTISVGIDFKEGFIKIHRGSSTSIRGELSSRNKVVTASVEKGRVLGG